MKVWSGSAWAEKPAKVWSGSAWVAKPVKVWSGSAWVTKPPAGGAAPTFRSFSNNTYGTRSSTVITKPSGVAENDILIASLYQERASVAPTAATPPSGWTQIGTTITGTGTGSQHTKFMAWWKRATSSEPADYTWAQGESNITQGAIQAWSGCPPSGSPIDVVAQNTGLSSTATIAGVTTTVTNTRLLWIGQTWDGSGTLTPPGGMTERYDYVNYLADEARPAAGATGVRDQGQASGGRWSVYLAALKGI